MPNSFKSSISNRTHITDLSISIISDKNKKESRPQSASSSRRGSLNSSNINNNTFNNNNSKQLMEDDLHSLRSIPKTQHHNRPPSTLKQQKESEKENINTSTIFKLDDDNVSEPVSWRDDSVSIRSYNNSPSLNHSKNSQRPQSSFMYSIAKRAPIIPRPGSAPLTKKGRLDASTRSKTPSELYEESFCEMQRRDESNAAINNPWHQTLDEHHERPLINTVLHEYRDGIHSRCSSRMSDKKDYIHLNKEAIYEKARNSAKRNSGTARPHSFVLDNSIEGAASEFSTSSHLEGEERRKSHTSLVKKFSTRQSVPRAVNSRTIFNPTTLAYDNTSPLRNRPKSALSKITYKQTSRHQDVVSVMSETFRPRSSMSNYSTKETSFKRPTTEEPFKKTTPFLNVQGFSINQSKVVHEGHYEVPKKNKRGAPKPRPQPHTVALCVHNSRFSIENR